MRNQMLPKAVREAMKTQPTVADLTDNQRAEIQAHQDMIQADIEDNRKPNKDHKDAILALEFLMGEVTDKDSEAYKTALYVVEKFYGKNSGIVVQGVMDDGEKFTQDGESRGSNYQHGGIA